MEEDILDEMGLDHGCILTPEIPNETSEYTLLVTDRAEKKFHLLSHADGRKYYYDEAIDVRRNPGLRFTSKDQLTWVNLIYYYDTKKHDLGLRQSIEGSARRGKIIEGGYVKINNNSNPS
jgi:hypothetical protein